MHTKRHTPLARESFFYIPFVFSLFFPFYTFFCACSIAYYAYIYLRALLILSFLAAKSELHFFFFAFSFFSFFFVVVIRFHSFERERERAACAPCTQHFIPIYPYLLTAAGLSPRCSSLVWFISQGHERARVYITRVYLYNTCLCTVYTLGSLTFYPRDCCSCVYTSIRIQNGCVTCCNDVI